MNVQPPIRGPGAILPTRMSCADAAEIYVGLGWPVFPVRPDKRPYSNADLGLPPDAPGGFHAATRDVDQLRRWLRGRPRSGIAIPMGPATGVWVLDSDIERADPRTGEILPSGEATLAELEARYGPLPQTLTSRTGGGGRQYVFAWRGERVRNRARDIGPGLDTRGVTLEGEAAGYVVLPPSPHHSGGSYAWEDLTPSLDAILPAPDWLIWLATFGAVEREALAARGITGPEGFSGVAPKDWPVRAAQVLAAASTKTINGSGRGRAGGALLDDVKSHYARRAIEREIESIIGAPPGCQETTINDAALRTWSLIKGAGLERDAGEFRDAYLSACRTLSNAPGRPPWKERDFVTKWDRARGPAQPRDLSFVGQRVRPNGNGGFHAGLPAWGPGMHAGLNGSAGLEPGAAEAAEDEVLPTDSEPEPYDVEAVNREFAVVLQGSRAAILHEQADAGPQDQVRFLAIEAFRTWYANRFVTYRGPDGKEKTASWGARWLADRQRRQYRGVEFHPDPDNAPGSRGYFNLWRGFGIAPVEKAGAYETFHEHLYCNVCRESEDLFGWVFGWFAHILQRPRERPDTSLAIRGKKGTGKTKIGEVFGSLIPRHYALVDTPRYVVGNFNAHMASLLLLQADEGFWAGDHAAESRLKGLITSKTQMIEPKGVDAIPVANYLRLLITANATWTVPASLDERRYCVIDIAETRRQDHAFFARIDAEMDAGGREALLWDLLHVDLDQVNLRQIPMTEELLQQKILSLEGVEGWWLGCLMAGAQTRSRDAWDRRIPKDEIFDDYIGYAEKIGLKRRSSETQVGIALARLVPGLGANDRASTVEFGDRGPGKPKRPWLYTFPPLCECRRAFVEQIGQPVTWPPEEPDP